MSKSIQELMEENKQLLNKLEDHFEEFKKAEMDRRIAQRFEEDENRKVQWTDWDQR